MFENKGSTSISISTGTIIRVVLIGLGVFLMWYLRDLVLVVLTAIVIASFMGSAVPHIQKLGFSRIFGIVFLYFISLLAFAAMFYLFAPLLVTEIYNFSTFISGYVPNISFFHYFQNDAFSGAKDVVSALGGNFSVASLLAVSKAFILNLSGGFFQIISVAFGSIFNFLMIILISFYLSVQEKGIENFLHLIVPEQYDDYVVDLWNRSSHKIALWVRGQMLLALVVAVLIYLLLSLFGIQYALLLSLIAGIMEMVPYGILVALVPAFAFSYLSGGITDALVVTACYVIVHQFEIFLFSPLIIKKIVGLSPIVIILSVLIGFELGGFWGGVLSIPVGVVIMEFLSDVEKNKILAKANSK